MKITRRFEFDAAHRLMGYEGPCANIHGHRYVAEITVEGDTLNDLGMLVDFKVLKCIGIWIDTHWDHALLLHPGDNEDFEGLLTSTKIYKMLFGNNPTAEHMARELSRVAKDFMTPVVGVQVANVRLYETPDCFVDCST